MFSGEHLNKAILKGVSCFLLSPAVGRWLLCVGPLSTQTGRSSNTTWKLTLTGMKWKIRITELFYSLPVWKFLKLSRGSFRRITFQYTSNPPTRLEDSGTPEEQHTKTQIDKQSIVYDTQFQEDCRDFYNRETKQPLDSLWITVVSILPSGLYSYQTLQLSPEFLSPLMAVSLSTGSPAGSPSVQTRNGTSIMQPLEEFSNLQHNAVSP